MQSYNNNTVVFDSTFVHLNLLQSFNKFKWLFETCSRLIRLLKPIVWVKEVRINRIITYKQSKLNSCHVENMDDQWYQKIITHYLR